MHAISELLCLMNERYTCLQYNSLNPPLTELNVISWVNWCYLKMKGNLQCIYCVYDESHNIFNGLLYMKFHQ